MALPDKVGKGLAGRMHADYLNFGGVFIAAFVALAANAAFPSWAPALVYYLFAGAAGIVVLFLLRRSKRFAEQLGAPIDFKFNAWAWVAWAEASLLVVGFTVSSIWLAISPSPAGWAAAGIALALLVLLQACFMISFLFAEQKRPSSWVGKAAYVVADLLIILGTFGICGGLLYALIVELDPATSHVAGIDAPLLLGAASWLAVELFTFLKSYGGALWRSLRRLRRKRDDGGRDDNDDDDNDVAGVAAAAPVGDPEIAPTPNWEHIANGFKNWLAIAAMVCAIVFGLTDANKTLDMRSPGVFWTSIVIAFAATVAGIGLGYRNFNRKYGKAALERRFSNAGAPGDVALQRARQASERVEVEVDDGHEADDEAEIQSRPRTGRKKRRSRRKTIHGHVRREEATRTRKSSGVRSGRLGLSFSGFRTPVASDDEG